MAARVTAFVVFAIVAVTFVAGLIVGAQRADDSGPVDLIVYNAKVYTGDQKAPFAEAIAVRGNRILRVGSNRDIKRLMRRATTVIDAHGGSVTAGFHDGRVDLAAAGRAIALAKSAAQVAPPSAASSDTRSEGERAAERLDDLRAAMADANRVGLTSVEVTARTADELAPYDTLLRNRELTARINAALAVDWPLNDAALDQLEQTRRTYQRVPLFKLDAIRLTVSDGIDEAGTHASATGPAVSRPAHATAGRDARAFSVTHATAADSAPRVRIVPASMVTSSPELTAVPAAVPPIEAHPLRGPRTARGGRMSARATAAAAAALAARTTDLGQTITRLGSRGWQIILQTADAGDATLALNALESSGAAIDTNSASSSISGSGSNGASGTSGTSGTGGASAAAGNKPASSAPKPRIRLELGAPVDEATAARFVRLGVIASIPQPGSASASLHDASIATAPSSPLHLDPSASASAAAALASPSLSMSSASRDAGQIAASSLDRDAGTSAATAPAAGPAATAAREGTATGGATALAAEAGAAPRVPESWPYANLLEGTGSFVFHSGWPDTPLDPRFALSVVLLEGLLLTGGDPAVIEDAAKLSARLTRALDAYTREAAYACADENQEGTIAKEMLADLVVFSTDLFTLPPDKLLDAEVTTTIFDGKVVYTKPPDSGETTASQ